MDLRLEESEVRKLSIGRGFSQIVFFLFLFFFFFFLFSDFFRLYYINYCIASRVDLLGMIYCIMVGDQRGPRNPMQNWEISEENKIIIKQK